MSYCRSLTDTQLENVLCDEFQRKERGGEVGKAAADLYQEAREECLRRGKEPDMILLERGVATFGRK